MIKMNNHFFSNKKKLGAPLIEYLDLNEGKVHLKMLIRPKLRLPN